MFGIVKGVSVKSEIIISRKTIHAIDWILIITVILVGAALALRARPDLLAKMRDRIQGNGPAAPSTQIAGDGQAAATGVEAIYTLDFGESTEQYAICRIVFTRFAYHPYATCRVFKSLNHFDPISNDSPSPQLPSREAETITVKKQQPAWGMGNLAFWDFNFLMANNQVAKVAAIRQRQKQTDATIERLAQGFVSWLLYAYSPAGQTVDDPVALASKRLLQNISTGMGGDFDRLARPHPFELKAFFDWDFEGSLLLNPPNTAETDIYLVNFKDLSKPKKRELYRRLFGAS